MQIGRRVYSDKVTGNVICDTGERQGSVFETTTDDDFTTHPSLAGRSLADTNYLELAYGADLQQALIDNNLTFPLTPS